MDFTLPETTEITAEDVSLFKGPVAEVGAMSCDYREYRPVSQIVRGAPVTFSLISTDYLDLSNTRLNVKVKITKANGTPVVIGDQVGFVNNVLHSLFRSVEVKLQQQGTTIDVGTNYSYKAMIDTLLEEPKLPLNAQLFYKDTYMFMDSVEANSGQNGGLTDRWSFTKDGGIVEMEGNLHADVLKQPRLLINGVRLDVILYPNPDEFCLMVKGDKEFKVQIVDATLKICHNKIGAATLNAHSKILETKSALYPITHSEVKVYNIPAGSYTWSMDDVFQEKIPSRVVIGIVPEQGFVGSFTRNPFNFKNWSVNYLGFLVDGQTRPGQPYQPDFQNGAFMAPYLALGQKYKDDRTWIGLKDFQNGYCLYNFQVEENNSVIKRGRSTIVLKMNRPLPEAVTLIAYGHFPGLVEIDKARNVTLRV